MKPANNGPVYACLYADIATITRKHGYALAIHGSLARDFDCVCIPWADDAGSPQTVVEELVKEFALVIVKDPETGRITDSRAHGRLIYTLSVKFGDVFLDLSFMPRREALPEGVNELQHQLAVANEFIKALEQRLHIMQKRLDHGDTELAQARVSRDVYRQKLTDVHDELIRQGITLTHEVGR